MRRPPGRATTDRYRSVRSRARLREPGGLASGSSLAPRVMGELALDGRRGKVAEAVHDVVGLEPGPAREARALEYGAAVVGVAASEVAASGQLPTDRTEPGWLALIWTPPGPGDTRPRCRSARRSRRSPASRGRRCCRCRWNTSRRRTAPRHLGKGVALTGHASLAISVRNAFLRSYDGARPSDRGSCPALPVSSPDGSTRRCRWGGP